MYCDTGVENPKVVVSTKPTENGIEIKFSDNGPDIPEAIKDKIFQPFFTTKPPEKVKVLVYRLATIS